MTRVTVDDALDQESAVLKAFVAEDGSLLDLPTKLRKRLVVLHYVAQAFDVGRDYPEVEVKSVLRAFHPDVAATWSTRASSRGRRVPTGVSRRNPDAARRRTDGAPDRAGSTGPSCRR
ncbi:DUF2087 domain-containing protein [Branchiibius cervicis]|uniref:DUF2087 domain-containing protein n=1 Tax=Branchiibius cervicis TaxID=908252 RepID=A0ABW2AQL0_9MICO